MGLEYVLKGINFLTWFLHIIMQTINSYNLWDNYENPALLFSVNFISTLSNSPLWTTKTVDNFGIYTDK